MMDNTSISSTELGALVLGDELLYPGITDSISTELDHIFTQSLTSKDDVWPAVSEGTQSTLYRSGPPRAESPSVHSTTSTWNDPLSLTHSPTVTSPTSFCDLLLADDFDLLAYTENSMDSSDQLESTILSTEQDQKTEAESQTPEQHDSVQPHECMNRSDNDITDFRFWQKQDFPQLPIARSGMQVQSMEAPRSEGFMENNPGENCKPSREYQRSSSFPTKYEQVSDLPQVSEKLCSSGIQLPTASRENNSATVNKAFTDKESSPGQLKDGRCRGEGDQVAVKGPKRPKNGFIRFSVQHRTELSRRYPHKDNRAISKLLGTRWKKMTPEQKRPYQEEFSKAMHQIRAQNPMWRYAPVRQLSDNLVEPMATRLRPRHKIRSRFENVTNESDWDVSTHSTDTDDSTAGESSTSLLQCSVTSCPQCNVCRLWRPLPTHVAVEGLPDKWNCSKSMCSQVRPVAVPDAVRPHLFSVLQPTAPVAASVLSSSPAAVRPHLSYVLQPTAPVAASVPSSSSDPCHSIFLPRTSPPSPVPLLLISTSLPILYTPASSVTAYTVLGNQYSAAS